MNQAQTPQDVRESLCAGVDGELSAEQWRFLLRRLDHDASLRQLWSRFHLARDGMRRQLPAIASEGFADRVMQAIEGSVDAAVVMPRRHSHWLRWSGGGAIAASVAVAALMISQPAGDGGRISQPALQQSTSIATATPASKPVAPAAVPPWLSGNSAGLLSQQASATLGAPFENRQPAYSQRLSNYPAMPRYRTLDNRDGSYLLLLDPRQSAAADSSSKAAADAQ